MFPHQIANAPVRLAVARPMVIPGITPPLMPPFNPARAPMPTAQPRLSVTVPPSTVQQLWDDDCEAGKEACSRPNFEWHNNGLAVWTSDANGQPRRVFFPLHQVDLVFQRETAKVGCPLGETVGDYSVGGFFKKLGRGLKKFHNIVTFKKVRQKIGRGIKKQLSKSKFGRGLLKAGNKIVNVAKKVGKVGLKIVRSKIFRGALAAVGTAFPVLAPGVAALEAGQQIADRIERAKKIAERVKRGLTNPKAAAGIIAEGAKAAGIAGKAFEAAKRGERDGMEMMGAIKKIASGGVGRTARTIARRAGPSVSRGIMKAAKRRRMLRRRRRAHRRNRRRR